MIAILLKSWIVNRIKRAIVRKVKKRMFKKLKELAKMKGSLSYTMWGATIIGYIGTYLDIEITTEETQAIVAVGVAVVGIYARWRATRNLNKAQKAKASA